MRTALSITVVLLLNSSLSSQTTQDPEQNSCELLTQSKTWQKTHKERQEEFLRLFKPDRRNQILSFNKDWVLKAITSNPDFEPLFEARYWMGSSFENAKVMIPALIALLTESKLVGLKNSADVIIFERIDSGDLKAYGHGWVIGDDLFQVSGRASWLLKEMTGENFGDVKKNSTAVDLKKVQGQWADWYNQFNCR